MRWIFTQLVIDMNTGEVLESRGFQYEGPVAECKPGKSGTQQTAEATQVSDQAQQDKLTGAAQGTLSQFEGPVQNSPFYKALLTQGTEATSRAYDTARANTASRAKAAGFGYAQPIAQGAQDQVGSQEAEALARLPGDTMLQAAQPAQQAAGETAQIGANYGQQGSAALNNATTLQNTNSQNSLWNKLWSLPQSAAQGVGAYIGAGGCWIAATVYGSWDAPQVFAVRNKLWKDAGESCFMRVVLGLYLAFGEYAAAIIKRSSFLKRIVRKFLDSYVSQP